MQNQKKKIGKRLILKFLGCLLIWQNDSLDVFLLDEFNIKIDFQNSPVIGSDWSKGNGRNNVASRSRLIVVISLKHFSTEQYSAVFESKPKISLSIKSFFSFPRLKNLCMVRKISVQRRKSTKNVKSSSSEYTHIMFTGDGRELLIGLICKLDLLVKFSPAV